MFSSIEPSGSSVIMLIGGRGLGGGGSWLDCGLGKPVRCSSSLVYNCGCRPQALKHLISIYNVDIEF